MLRLTLLIALFTGSGCIYIDDKDPCDSCSCAAYAQEFAQQCSPPCLEDDPCSCDYYTTEYQQQCTPPIELYFDEEAYGCGDMTVYRSTPAGIDGTPQSIAIHINHIRNDGGITTYNVDDADITGEFLIYDGFINTHYCNDTPSEITIYSRYSISGGTVTVMTSSDNAEVYRADVRLNDTTLVLEEGEDSLYGGFYINEIFFGDVAVGWLPG